MTMPEIATYAVITCVVIVFFIMQLRRVARDRSEQRNASLLEQSLLRVVNTQGSPDFHQDFLAASLWCAFEKETSTYPAALDFELEKTDGTEYSAHGPFVFCCTSRPAILQFAAHDLLGKMIARNVTWRSIPARAAFEAALQHQATLWLNPAGPVTKSFSLTEIRNLLAAPSPQTPHSHS